MKLYFVGPLLASLIFAASAANVPAEDIQLSNSASAPTTAATATAFPGVKCVLRAENGQTQFRRGETIHLVASFTSDRPGYKINRLVQNNRSALKLGDIEISPSQGVIDPLGELPPQDGIFISGFVPEPVTLSKKPVEFPFVLNDWARFDKTGVYQITLATARVFAAKPNDQQRRDFMFNMGALAPVASEPLQIEIVPADEVWANQQIELTRAYWRKAAKSPTYPESEAPRNDISFLGTRAAMTAIIEHLGQNKEPRSSGDDSYEFRTGLIGFADRAWLVGEMKRASEQPNYAVTQGFFDLLVELQSLQNTPRPVGADATRLQYDKGAKGQWIARKPTPAQQLQIDWEKRRADARAAATSRDWLQISAASKAKTARARAMTLHTLLELAWLTNLQKEPPIKAQLPKLVAQLAPIFDQLPPLARAYLLGDEWDRIKSPAFVPALERARKLPINKNDYYAKDAASLTLKRLAEIAPKSGRAQIIEQIKHPQPGVDFQALSGLPDKTLPALDDVLAKNYLKADAQSESLALAAKLLWRYASPAALPRIKASYETSSDRLDYAPTIATLAYFVRVNPGYGVPKVAARAREFGKRDFYSSFLFDVSSLQFSPQLETLAIANLTNAGEGTAGDAAKTLARFGSSAARNALMARLKNTSDAKYPKVRARVESKLVEALANGQSWLCPPAQLRQIRALCQTDEGRRITDEYLSERANREPLIVNYSSGTGNYWDVAHYSGRGMETLRAKLAQFPRGTQFFWQMTGSGGPDAAKDFATTRKWAAQRGLKIEPYEKIVARRKALGLN